MSAAQEQPPLSSGKPFGNSDIVAIGLVSAGFLLAAYLRCRNTIFWSDEIMGWLVLHEPSLSSFFRSWWAGADSSGLIFYATAAPWLHLFGEGPIALRLFSAVGVLAAFALTWLIARRYFDFATVLTCLPVVFACSGTVPWQLTNGRSYGLYLAGIALAAYALVDGAPPRRAGRGLLLLTFLANLVLLGSHILGPLFAGAFFVALLLLDVLRHVRRPALYLSAAAAWLIMPLNWPNYRATLANGKPTFWTPRPRYVDALAGVSSFSRGLEWAIGLLLAGVLIAYLVRRREVSGSFRHAADRLPLYLVFAALFGSAAAMWIISRVTTSIFVDRYLLPMVIADALLCCELLSRLKRLLSLPTWFWQALTLPLLLISASQLNALAHARYGLPPLPYTGQLLASLPQGIPVITTEVGTFAEVNFYEHDRVALFTPIDWPITLENAKKNLSASGTHEMENWKKLGYYPDRIQPTEQLLANLPRFVVLTPNADTLWLDRRVRADPRFSVQYLGSFHLPYQAPQEALTEWAVQRK